ncbi:MAG: D-alanine--D-alanine ligase family protein [Acidobacteriota bacterium]
MADKKLDVVLLFGGRSAEHDVSTLSARSVRAAADPARLNIIPVCIRRDGQFLDPAGSMAILDGASFRAGAAPASFSFEMWIREHRPDAVFPLIHGTTGEDGTLQGYLEMLDLPCVGSGVTASAVGMDKWFMKAAFATAGLPIVRQVTASTLDWRDERQSILDRVEARLMLPFFVKPANAGSSVGVSKVKTIAELDAAVAKAFRFDEKILIEEGIDAREVEVSVLGNETPEVSLPGEIVLGREFYDYEDKYIEDKSSLVIPADLPPEKIAEIREMGAKAFKAIGASGYARVDFFIERTSGQVLVNEINTIPGFTRISMYPKLWEASGLPYPRLIERLVDLAIQRWQSRQDRFVGMMSWFDEVKRLT